MLTEAPTGSFNLKAAETKLIESALATFRTRKEAARELGISLRQLQRIIKSRFPNLYLTSKNRNQHSKVSPG